MSSSGHLVLVPVLLRMPYAGLEPELRKSFEVALHAGSALALAVALRSELREMLEPRQAALLALTAAPPALVGLAFERQVERRLGTPTAVAVAQVAAGAALWLADGFPASRGRVGAGDALAVGAAQVLALAPGVSRAGSALTAARLRGLRRGAAARLSRRAALPITTGAGLLKGVRAASGELPREMAGPFAAGALAALVSGVAARGLAERLEGASSFRAVAAYRVALGAVSLVVMHGKCRT